MAIAQQTPTSLAIEVFSSNHPVSYRLWSPLHWSAVSLARLWWHTKAYSTIFGVLALAAVSLVFLQVHWVLHRLWKTSVSQSAEPS